MRDVDEGGSFTLEEALYGLNSEELKKVARLVSDERRTRKAELVALVSRHLEGDRLRALFERLDPLQKSAVAEVVHSRDDRLVLDRFVAKYGQAPNRGRETYGSRTRASLFRLFLYGYEVDHMPPDLKERLRAFVPPPAPARLATVDDLPSELETGGFRDKSAVRLVVREMERAAQRNVLAVLRLVDSGKLPVSETTRRPSGAAMRAVTSVLDGGDFYEDANDAEPEARIGPIQAFAWPLLVQAGRLAEPAGTRLRLTRAGLNALGEPPAQTIRLLWTRWLETTLLDELSRIDSIEGQSGKAKRSLTAVEARRRAIGAALADCPVGRWVQIDEFFRYLRASGHDFEVTRNPWHLYFSSPRYGSLGYDGSHDFCILQARYALCLLLEYAASLGLVDVAIVAPHGARDDYGSLWGTDDLPFISRYDGLSHVRLTALGAYALGATQTYEAPPVESRRAIRVLPNFEVVAAGEEILESDRLALDAYAERTSEGVWRLDRKKLLAVLDDGRSLSEVRDYLEARSASPLPETVTRLLDDLDERAGRLVDRGVARLVECEDAPLAALIANDPRAKRTCLLAGDRFLAVPLASEAAFRRAVRDLGYPLAPVPPDRERVGRA